MSLNTMFKDLPEFKVIEPYKFYYNVGCLMDIPTGFYVKGQKGENIMNGGLANLTAITGKGNTFKSTIEHYIVLSAADKVAQSGTYPYINTYDTEMNIQLERLKQFTRNFESFKDNDIISENTWVVTDKTNHSGNEWFKMLREFLKTVKIKNKDKYMVVTPFLDKDKNPVKTLFPSFGEVDSLSEFVTDDIADIQDKNELGDSAGNMIHAKIGLAKTRLLMELPGLCAASAHYLAMTAHLGNEVTIQQSPYTTPSKKLQHMKMGEKIKGVPDKFYFLINLVWQTINSSLLINQNTKGSEYPKDRSNSEEGSTDLNVVTVKFIRNKNGPSGNIIDIIISQEEGVLPTLTEFHFLKENDRYGLEGNLVNYSLALYPEVKLSRTTVRSHIDNNPELRQAIKFTADLLQIKQKFRNLPFAVPTPQELYAKLDKEYGFKKLLNTRDYWTFNQYTHPKPFLSAMDLLEMYYGLYKPYWL